MNEKFNVTYSENIRFLKSMIGCYPKAMVQEQYYFQSELDKESMGALKIKFSNGKEFVFGCHGDSESLSIREGNFSDKGTLETDFEDDRYKWQEKELLNPNKLDEFGKIRSVYLEELTKELRTIQSGCKIEFENGEYLRIWTIESDNIFYGINKKPPYLENKDLKIELIEIRNSA